MVLVRVADAVVDCQATAQAAFAAATSDGAPPTFPVV
eukprot:gene49069-31041_t